MMYNQQYPCRNQTSTSSCVRMMIREGARRRFYVLKIYNINRNIKRTRQELTEEEIGLSGSN